MSRLTDLIAQAKAKDSELGKELEREFKALANRRAFGLNFERHRPESVELPGRPVRKGDKVRILPPRGETKKGDPRLWRVRSLSGSGDGRMAEVDLIATAEPETQKVAVADLVVVAEFRDYIYPGLVSTGKVERGGDKPYNTVINGENFHALEALTFTHRGKIDAIYIDPPYNTGAKDWKYNNDYVEGEDLYRHSKWLAMMERRLLVARELLNPNHSVLVVTIDEKEYLRLGLLLEQVFPEAAQQMVTIVINPNGVARGSEMARVEEYAFFLFFGVAGPSLVYDSLLDTESLSGNKRNSVRWEWLLRGGNNSRREDRPNLFFPVFIDPIKRVVVDVGETIPLDTPRSSVPDRPGLTTVWPLRAGRDEEATWQKSPKSLRKLFADGFARVGAYDEKNERWSILYLGPSQLRRIDAGELVITGEREDGSKIVDFSASGVRRTPKTVWNRGSHKAGEYGSMLVRRLTGGRKFPFPKSLYAVEDALRVAVGENPTATILDFFAGSGTTAHAVMRLNHQDGGLRKCISVTNNEVAAEEVLGLRKKGLRPGDNEWEKWGICDYITKPRIEAAITGKSPDGREVSGDYKFTDEFPMAEGFEENAEFFTLTYETPVAVSHNRAFARIAPLLWMRAGSEGRRIDKEPPDGWGVADTYGLLTDLDQSAPFVDAVVAQGSIRIAYIVTDDDRRFQSVAQRLPDEVEPVRLYESYLTNFRFAMGR
ncbi:site-specific DNA-methyltransferase [Donghicola sp. C2-DW-16]|uniref:site-specific DNA-methyltransferase (adenine-specific) n=1 Tax=Donghicola mangrovi TaxID=2729614 RepID=A0ABX2PI11_9RHOB|nr:DNA methyltransferase [Donghicola mangrovi]NVO29130.1 site-specific DNA-methyltransferase [Donghicola mangrovi]